MQWAGCGATNAKVIAAAQIGDIAFGRKNAKLMHNKFIVLCQNATPKAVWTGSTNISRYALYGQLNCGQVVRGTAIARQFLAYWQKLRADPQADALRAVAIAEIARNRRLPNIGMALGSNITVDWIDDRTDWVPDRFRSGSEKANKRRYSAGGDCAAFCRCHQTFIRQSSCHCALMRPAA